MMSMLTIAFSSIQFKADAAAAAADVVKRLCTINSHACAHAFESSPALTHTV